MINIFTNAYFQEKVLDLAYSIVKNKLLNSNFKRYRVDSTHIYFASSRFEPPVYDLLSVLTQSESDSKSSLTTVLLDIIFYLIYV